MTRMLILQPYADETISSVVVEKTRKVFSISLFMIALLFWSMIGNISYADTTNEYSSRRTATATTTSPPSRNTLRSRELNRHTVAEDDISNHQQEIVDSRDNGSLTVCRCNEEFICYDDYDNFDDIITLSPLEAQVLLCFFTPSSTTKKEEAGADDEEGTNMLTIGQINRLYIDNIGDKYWSQIILNNDRLRSDVQLSCQTDDVTRRVVAIPMYIINNKCQNPKQEIQHNIFIKGSTTINRYTTGSITTSSTSNDLKYASSIAAAENSHQQQNYQRIEFIKTLRLVSLNEDEKETTTTTTTTSSSKTQQSTSPTTNMDESDEMIDKHGTDYDLDDDTDDAYMVVSWALGLTFGMILLIIGIIGTMREVVALCLDCVD